MSAKRAFDVAVGSTLLVALAPVMALEALAILLLMGRPILFRQERPGLGERPFRLLKFRTMRPPAIGGAPESDAERLTPLGRILRRTSLDELPQLWNVIRGDMSLVGPRPLLVDYLALYDERQARRHAVRPGVTGWAQVKGRNAISWQQRLAYDVWYVDNRSLALDLRILLLTVARVLRREGISQPGHATMERFRGSGAAD